ncbi:MAG: CoA transferase subunit A [bacterium]|nr:CoA transferase subunit A [bacterium]
MNKIFKSVNEAVFDINDNATLMVAGFGLCGNPENLIAALREKGPRQLTVISNNCGTNDFGLSLLLKNRQIKKMISSYVGENASFEKQFLTGEIEVELMPQGTLAEKIRAGGAGIAAFFTCTGAGTQVELGGLPMRYDSNGEVVKASSPKETKKFGNKTYLLEESLQADFALIRAYKADTFGNLVFHKTARNFNPMMCTAAKVTIVEAEHIVAAGEIDPECIHVPGVYVKRIVQGQNYARLIENRTTRVRGDKHAA